jgi:predicted nucleic acid-binding protein
VVLEIDNSLRIVDNSLKTQIKAVRLKGKYGFQYYDALIVATALEHGCNILFSEDMQHGQVIEDSLRIINPF